MKDSTGKRLIQLRRGLRANQSAFIETACKTHDIQLASLCYQLASERGRFTKLIDSVDSHRDMQREKTLRMSMMRPDRRLRAALRHGDTYAVLGCLIRSEDDLIGMYETVVAEVDHAAIEEEVQDQFRTVKEARARLRALREDDVADGQYESILTSTESSRLPSRLTVKQGAVQRTRNNK